MGKSGRILFEIDAQGWQAPYVHIHRADLVGILADHYQYSGSGRLKFGFMAKFTHIDDQLNYALERYNTVSGGPCDIFIAADGIRSANRSEMTGKSNPRFTGNIAWRAVVPTENLGALAPAPNATVWMGDKKHCVTYRLRGGDLTNFVGIVETDQPGEELWTLKGALSDLKHDFHNWHPVIANLINNVDENALYKWALFDRDPLPVWTQDKVALMGDAAHPILPFMAQGAAMAIEDAWVLAKALSHGNFGSYESVRRPRTTRLLEQSRANMKTFHRAKGLKNLSYLPMWIGGRVAPNLIKNRFDWIYNHDVTT